MIDALARRIAQLTPEEHGFTYFDATQTAQASGRLDGWVIPAKDLDDVAGMPTSQGSVDRTYTPSTTDPFLQKLLDQGAVIPGKSSSPELGLAIHTEPIGLPWPENPLYPGKSPGGSSGGAAVMVARGLVRAAHATDSGGSIRVPAAACGLVGYKPPASGLTAHGFLTTNVADQAFLHDIELSKRHLRIGVLTQPLNAETEVDPDWEAGTRQAAEAARALGHEVVEVAAWPRAQETFDNFKRIFMSQLAQLPDASGYAQWIKKSGQALSPAEVAQAHDHAAQLPELLRDFWEVDVLLTPMLSADPPAIGHFAAMEPADNFYAQTQWSPWAATMNIAGLGAIAVPWPRENKPPTSIHLVALTASQGELLQLASDLEHD